MAAVKSQNLVTCKRPQVLLCIHGGGFILESSFFARGLRDVADFVYAHVEGQVSTEGLDLPPGKSEMLVPLRTHSNASISRLIRGTWADFWRVRSMIQRHGIDVVAVMGSNLALPAFLAAKSKGRRTLFVESMTRTRKISATGRICKALGLVDRFYVQWPALADPAKNLIYKGMVL